VIYRRENTTDLAEFSISAISDASDLLNAWMRDGLPDGFEQDNVTVMLNPNSGYVFLTNAELQAAVIEHGKLVEFLTSPYDCHEGTLTDLIDAFDAETWHPEDIEWFDNLNNKEGA
jgi:hypothetical protein